MSRPRRRDATRDRIIEAAGGLLYGDGIQCTSMDAIAAQAGVTKRTLYYHFRSKDDLVADCLSRADRPVRERYAAWLGPADAPIERRIRRLFEALARRVDDPRWKGCGFLRAANELAGSPGHPAIAIARAHRSALESWLAATLSAERIADATRLARRLVLLLDGAIVQALLCRDPAYVAEAGDAAADLVMYHRRTADCARRPQLGLAVG